jgi:hypothetical protein
MASKAQDSKQAFGRTASSSTGESSASPHPEIYDENGVDRSLTRSCLKRTPTECLDILEDMHRLAESVRRVH